MFKKKVSKTSSSLCPRASLLQPCSMATEFSIPLRKFAHKEHGLFSFLISKTISLIWLSISKYSTPILEQVSFKNSEDYFKTAKRVVYTGNPCGENALLVPKVPKSTYGFKESDKLIIIVAGSLGSSSLNEKFKAFLKLVGNEEYKIVYITGKNLYDDFVKDMVFPKNVKVVPYIDNLAGLMKNAYLVVSRAGASTISEILALKVPSVLIPSPYVAGNHQYYNALDLVNMHVAELIEEKQMDANLIQVTINELINTKKYEEFKKNLEHLNLRPASTIIYEEIKELVK